MKFTLVLCLLLGWAAAYPRDMTCGGLSRRTNYQLKDCRFDQRNSTINCTSYLFLGGSHPNRRAIEMTSTFFPLINERYTMFINGTTYKTCLGLRSMSLRKVDSIPSQATNVFISPSLVVALQERFQNFSATIEVNSPASVGFLANLEECRTKQWGSCSPQVVATSFIVTPGSRDDFDELDLVHGNYKKFYIENMKARLDTLKLHLSYGPELNLWLPYFKNTKLKHLYLDGNEVHGFDKNEMESFPQLETLSMQKCSLERISSDNFQRGATNLKQLDLSGNKLLEVPSGVKFLKKLENLNLSYQNTAARKFQLKDVLRNLTSLRVLNMTRTPLFEISRTSLPSNLEILDLSFCSLNSIPVDLFRNMRSLWLIYLNGNRLKSIHPDTFRGMNVSVHYDHPEQMPHNVTVHSEHFSSSSCVVRYAISLIASLLVIISYLH